MSEPAGAASSVLDLVGCTLRIHATLRLISSAAVVGPAAQRAAAGLARRRLLSPQPFSIALHMCRVLQGLRSSFQSPACLLSHPLEVLGCPFTHSPLAFPLKTPWWLERVDLDPWGGGALHRFSGWLLPLSLRVPRAGQPWLAARLQGCLLLNLSTLVHCSSNPVTIAMQ